MGEEITLTATLKDGAGNPIQGESVRFFVAVDFFAAGQMEIGESVTGANGEAVLRYIPRVSGDRQFLVRHGSAEAVAAVNLEDTGALFYQSEAGLKLPSAGPVKFVGPDSATGIDTMGQAPTSAFYLPGGLTSWLLLVVAAIAMVWFSYFRVIRQIAGIPGRQDNRDIDTRLLPRLALAYVVILGILLALKIVIGPYTHFHLLQ